MLLVSIFHSYLVLSLVGDGLVDLSLVQTYVLFLLIWMLDCSGFMCSLLSWRCLCTPLLFFTDDHESWCWLSVSAAVCCSLDCSDLGWITVLLPNEPVVCRGNGPAQQSKWADCKGPRAQSVNHVFLRGLGANCRLLLPIYIADPKGQGGSLFWVHSYLCALCAFFLFYYLVESSLQQSAPHDCWREDSTKQ